MLTAHLDVIGGTERQCLRLARELAALGAPGFVLTRRPLGVPRRDVIEGVPVERFGGRLAAAILRAKRWRAGARGGEARPDGGGQARPNGDRETRARRGPARRVVSLLGHELPTILFERDLAATLRRRRSEYEVVHLHGVYWIALLRTAAALAGELGKPLVVKITNEPERTWAMLSAEAGALEALSRASAIITVSEAARSFFAARALGPSVELIPNGIPLPPGARQPGADLVCVGTLKRQKGIDVLLRAWADLSGRLLILGDGPERPALERLAKDLGIEGRVRFLGMRDDVDAHLRRARAFVLPSRWEGMPNALLEAMAHGVPCVATSVAGSVDLIEDGAGGLLVPPDDPGALAAALRRLFDDPALAARLGGGGRARVERDFTVRAVAERTLDLYARVAGPRRP